MGGQMVGAEMVHRAVDDVGGVANQAVDNVNTIIAPALIGKDPTAQVEIDNFMVHQLDGTKNEWGWCKQKLGANAILAVSLAVCKAGARPKKIPLYQHIANLAGNKNLVLCCLYPPSMLSMVGHMQETNLLYRSS